MSAAIDQPARRGGHFHAVRFYESHESLVRLVAEFLGAGLVQGQPVLVVATPEHREGVLAALQERHFDVEHLTRSGDLLLLDAVTTLEQFMVGGMPDADLLKKSAGELLDHLERGPSTGIRAYGEMVDILWRDGRTAAAIQLEMFWNQLAIARGLTLLCGYAMANFHKDAGFYDIASQHTHVVSPSGQAKPIVTRAVASVPPPD